MGMQCLDVLDVYKRQEGSREFGTDKINALVKEARDKGYRVAVIATDETADEYKDVTVTSIGTRESEDTIVNNLYEVLRKMDDMEIDCIYSESFSDCRLSTAIMNRLLKAAINTNDGALYIVPFAGYYRMDRNHKGLYNNWIPNRIGDVYKRQGVVRPMPAPVYGMLLRSR